MFTQRVQNTLNDLVDQVEQNLPDYDVDLEDGQLTIAAPDGGQYLFTRHQPTQQLWLSSPKSGAWHFAFINGQWEATRDPKALDHLLHEELGL